ncbi:MAG TPA: dihydroorotase [Paracoccaceae bacterium]|nr:dihydroorotase [Paracoccaceae bacterium]
MLILNNARIIDPEAGTETLGGVLIEHGRIAAVYPTPIEATAEGAEVIDCNGKALAPGIIDIGVKIGEPGERHKEGFRTAGRAAAAGGVTTVVTRPDTEPAIDTPELLEFFQNRAKERAHVRILPMAALTKGRAGKEMVEIGFMQDAGAVAFSDHDHVVQNPKLLQRAFTYGTATDALFIGHPQEPNLSAGACVTSGPFATKLGLPAVSTMAERMQLERDLAIVEMTGARYHADQITAASTLPALRRAKASGLRVTAGISIHHLTLNEFDAEDYKTFFKLTPPLRSEDDRRAMIEAVAEGEIDIICSMHTPQDEEAKRLPFEQAASGAVGLETMLPAALQLYHGEYLSLPQIFRALSLNPAKILGLDAGRIAVGAPADLVLFDPDVPFVLDRFKLHSKSKNTPYDGRRMQGQVIFTFVGGERIYERAAK